MKKYLLRLGAAALFFVFAVCLFPKNTYAGDADDSIDTSRIISVCRDETMTDGDVPYRSTTKYIKIFLEPSSLGVPEKYDIEPDYLEVTRSDTATGKTKKTKLAWKKFAADNYVYTDKKITAAHTYNYVFRTYKLVGKKKYYAEKKCSIANICAYNLLPTCDFKVLSKGDGTSEHLDIKFKSRKGNAPFVINKKGLREADLYNKDGVNEKRIKKTLLELYAVSYDEKKWTSVKENQDILLNENETIYLRFRYKSGELFNFDKMESGFYIVMPYLYATTKSDKAWLLELSCRTISGKTNEKNLMMDFYY